MAAAAQLRTRMKPTRICTSSVIGVETYMPPSDLDATAVLAPQGEWHERQSVAAAFPSVPVLPGTLLGLELLVQRPAFDLRAASYLIGEDPGALLHLFALAGEEYGSAGEGPVRLEECITSLSSQHLLRALATAGGARREQAQFADFARHGSAVGRCAQLVADSLDLSREEALLVGMLHELGTLPSLLGWTSPLPFETESVLWCRELGRRYKLPAELRSALDAVHGKLAGSVWVAVIDAAHDLLRTV